MTYETISPELLEMLCCPQCRGGLSPAHEKLTCSKCGSVYEVVDGIPVLHVPTGTSPSGA
jgi:uncharacterized protein YbaR (Trm112 family)